MSAKEKTTGFLAEFRKFIARGNVMDLAVGVIIGGAFKGITDSLVNDILNPVLGIFAGDNEALAGLAIPLPGGGDLTKRRRPPLPRPPSHRRRRRSSRRSGIF